MTDHPEIEASFLDPAVTRQTLDSALGQLFYAVLRVRPADNRVLILQSRDFTRYVGSEMDWGTYLTRYSRILTPEDQTRLLENLSAQALLRRAAEGEMQTTFDLSYPKGEQINWLSLLVRMRQTPGAGLEAFIFVQKNNEEHLLRRIIDLYVYSSCDYFIQLDLRHNRFVMFSSNPLESVRLSEVCEDYEAATVEYARDFVVPEDREMVIEKMRLDTIREQLAKKEVYSFTTGVTDPVRGYTRKRLSYRYYDRRSEMVLLSRTDVTEIYLEEHARQKELRAARRRAETDPLTGLLNYGGISERVDDLLEASDRPAALLFLDLDNFKQVNDTLGHPEGDKLLRKVAQILQLQTGKGDLQGRVGGDEFVVFLPRLEDRDQASRCASRICEGIHCLTLPEMGPHAVSCSVGVAFAPEDGRDYLTLARAADQRAYRAKRDGKNQFRTE